MNSCDEYIVPIPISPAVFGLLFIDDDPRRVLQTLAAPPAELCHREGFESFDAGTAMLLVDCVGSGFGAGTPFTRFDLLQALASICDALDALEREQQSQQSNNPDCEGGCAVAAADLLELHAELATKRVERCKGGWLEAVPGAFAYAAEYTTSDFLEMIAGMIEAWSLHTQTPLLRAVAQGEQELTIENVQPFTDDLLRAMAAGILPQMLALRQGIGEVLSLRSLQILMAEEMSTIFCGESEICWDVDKLLGSILVPGRNQNGRQYTIRDPAIAVGAVAPTCVLIVHVAGAGHGVD